MRRVWLSLSLVLLILPVPILALQINEIMYNPMTEQCAQDLCEWVELYNNHTFDLNLSGWLIDNNAIGDYTLAAGGYFVITKRLTGNNSFESVWGNNDSVWNNSDGNYTAIQLSISLKNTNDTINLTNGTHLDIVFYDSSQGGDGNGKSLCRLPDANITLAECNATPGITNNIANFTNATAGTCNLTLSIITNSTVYDAEKTLDYDIVVDDSACASVQHTIDIDYWIEDLFGNTVRRDNTTQSITCTRTIDRQWTPSSVTGSEAYIIKANITNPTCNDTDLTNNAASKIIVIKGNQTQPQTNSAIDITKVDVGSDNEIKFGETADIELTVYRGDTTKYAIDIYVKDSSGTKISEISTFHANSKFTTYDMSIPVQLKPNCDATFVDGTYTVVAEGLDASDTATIFANGTSSSTCKTITVTTTTSTPGGSSGGGGGGGAAASVQSNYEIVDYATSVAAGDEFTIKVKITNNLSVFKNFTVYSYVYKGNTPVSLGYNAEKDEWAATYTANQRSVGIGPKASATIELRNIIEDNTEPGTYNLRVRIKLDNKETDITREITVNPKPAKAEEQEESITVQTIPNQTGNETTRNQTRTAGGTTGFAIARQNYAFFSPIALLLQFLASIING